MRIRINSTTSYIDIMPYIECMSSDAIDRVKASALKAIHGEGFSFWQMSVADFLSASVGGIFDAIVGRSGYDTFDGTAYEYFCVLAFNDFAKDFIALMEGMTIPQTIMQQRASEGLPQSRIDEVMLVFARQYFGLPSFDLAGGISMSDFLMAKKHEYSKALFESNINRLQQQQLKLKSK